MWPYKVTLGGVVERLLTKTLIARTVNPRDRRARLLTITETGQTELARCEPVVEEVQQKILAGLFDQEQIECVF